MFRPPFELYPYQVKISSELYFRSNTIVAASTGLGKGCIALCTASLLYEDNKIDHIIIVCEKSKLYEWQDDIENFTDLSYTLYRGTVKGREKIRQNLSPVLIGLYETFRNDLAYFQTVSGPRGRPVRSMRSGELLLALEGKRVLFILDEAPAKLGSNRASYMYMAFMHARKKIDKSGGEFYSQILSATPVNNNPEGYFNLLKLLNPDLMTTEQFYKNYVRGYDSYNRASDYMNISPEFCNPAIKSLKEVAAPYMIIKDKNDPDVAPFFPEMPVPDFTYVRLSPKVTDFYWQVVQEFSGEDDMNDRALWTVMRQIAGHPQSLLNSKGDTAQEIVRKVGPTFLKSLATDKLDAFVDRLKVFKSQGSQVVAFTFFGQSILPLIHTRLLEEDFTVSINHGQMSSSEQELSQKRFKAGETQIFLSSDAGSRGISFGNAEYVENYESPILHSVYTQRINRVHRVNSVHAKVFAHTFVVRNTVEEAGVEMLLKREEYHDDLMGEQKITAQMVKDILKFRR